MDRHGREEQRSLLGFVLYALAAHGDPPLTQAGLSEALAAALESADGRNLADGVGLPSPELLGGVGEILGAFGDWLRARGLVEGCGFSRADHVLACEFRACVCLDAVDRLRAGRPDAEPPCVLVGALVALLRARGVRAAVVSYRRTDEGCEWRLDSRR
ncbi:MAG: hypothetical protein QHH80_05280 [Anaerolineae bacterium]|nr:hypothetical protein [Anaerolineae bacterium]